MPRPKKQVMMERPEELLRRYYEICTCPGDRSDSGDCDICKAQPEALAQLKKMRKSLVVMEAWQPPTKALKEDGKLSADEFEETMRALRIALKYVKTNGTKEQKDQLTEVWIETAKAISPEIYANSTGTSVTYATGATCASSGVVRVGPAEVAFPKEGTELHETLKKKGLLDTLTSAVKKTWTRGELYKPIDFELIKQEREACAKVIEAEMKGSKGYDGGLGDELAAAIRARDALSEDKALPEDWE